MRFSQLCYECFREGKADNALNTEIGLVTRDEAEAGITHGIPLRDPGKLQRAGYELTPHPVDPRFPTETWYGVHVDREGLLELLRTPSYYTWQGESWLFCCKRPMVFRGSIPSGLFNADVEKHPQEIADFLKTPEWNKTVDNEHGSHTYYAFICDICDRLRFNDDCD